MIENLGILYNYAKENKLNKGMHWISLMRSNSIFIVEIVKPIKRAAFLRFAQRVKSRKVCKETTESRKNNLKNFSETSRSLYAELANKLIMLKVYIILKSLIQKHVL